MTTKRVAATQSQFPRGSRSYIMSRIRGRDTKPEIMVRRYLFSRGLRFRKNDPRYPGKPDVVLPKYHTAIFINGCFWHHHQGCRYATTPKSNVEFWTQKFLRNQHRDTAEVTALTQLGWHVIVVWECELKKPVCAERLAQLYEEISQGKQ
ncbi:very short patch repair endonuclease [Bifidobacterium aquikefiricola]|uniref:Very short patch repair endonuclease n=1 Tax=Bifidobacterium aquikefiricola TaxID=3059038 RepID=A0AB39U6V2_9BIFI